MITPEQAQAKSWADYLIETPSAREENEYAVTADVRLQGHIVEVLSRHRRTAEVSVKTYRYRVLRVADAHVAFDTGSFFPKAMAQNKLKKAINALYELQRLKANSV